MRLLAIILLIAVSPASVCAIAQQTNASGYSHDAEARRMADFLLSLKQTTGAILDEPGGIRINEDSNMEYALMGLGAAYQVTHEKRYLTALEDGIDWLARHEEMNDPRWRGSWFLIYSAKTDQQLAVSPGPGYSETRGVDATSTLFAYLLYLDKRLTGNDRLAKKYSAQAHAALDFVVRTNLDRDGLSQSSWLKVSKTGDWVMFREKYSADQGDVYLGMHAAYLLYHENKYEQIAIALQPGTTREMFLASKKRFALGIDDKGIVDSGDDGNTAAFSQGYLAWVWGSTTETVSGTDWLESKVHPDGSIITREDKPAYSLNVAMLALANTSLDRPAPESSFTWLLSTVYDKSTGGVHHSPTTTPLDRGEENNEVGFIIMALYRFQPFQNKAVKLK